MKNRVYLAFRLFMPGRSSWDGKWSGDTKFFAVTRSVPVALAEKVLQGSPNTSYGYNFGDGWVANVGVSKIDGREKRQIDRKSKGFCGYNWMVDSILDKQRIMP